VEIDAYGNVSFAGMKIVTMMFDERPSFDKIFARACEEISCNINDPRISIQGLLSHITYASMGSHNQCSDTQTASHGLRR
jgi:hypothetical protein